MSYTKFTKGPWSYEERCSGIAIYQPAKDDAEEVITAMIVPKNDEDECTDEDEANARLISCAPEMLEALKRILGVWDAGLSDNLSTEDYNAIRELISKAEQQ